MSSFNAPPPPPAGFSMAQHIGSLILIDVVKTEVGLVTSAGVADVIRGNVVVLDGDGAGETYDDTIIFGKVLYAQLKGSIGQRILGRVSQGKAKPGQSAPWILAEASAEDIAKAETWVTANAKPTVSSAQPPF